MPPNSKCSVSNFHFTNVRAPNIFKDKNIVSISLRDGVMRNFEFFAYLLNNLEDSIVQNVLLTNSDLMLANGLNPRIFFSRTMNARFYNVTVDSICGNNHCAREVFVTAGNSNLKLHKFTLRNFKS